MFPLPPKMNFKSVIYVWHVLAEVTAEDKPLTKTYCAHRYYDFHFLQMMQITEHD